MCSGFKPAAVTATPNFSDDGIAGVLNCMFHEAIGEVATDDHNAENIATQIGAFVEKTGQSVSAETIEATAKRPSASPTPAPQQHVYYDNYGATTQGVPMCRGNQGNPASMPGGTVTQTFTANANGTINSTKVQIDPDNTVTAAAVLNINGTDMASNSEPASGDVVFTFSQVAVKAGTRSACGSASPPPTARSSPSTR